MQYKTTWITLTMMITFMGTFIVVNTMSDPSKFIAYMGFAAGQSGTLLSWVLAAITVSLYCWSASSISDVKRYMFKFDLIKGVAIIAALCAGIVEEIVFRKWIMDYLAAKDFSIVLQILVSGLAFGLAHLVWGFKNIKAGINAALSTFLLGVALAIVYWLGDRSLAPCIVAHFLVTALIEPGLLISAERDRLGYFSEQNKHSSS